LSVAVAVGWLSKIGGEVPVQVCDFGPGAALSNTVCAALSAIGLTKPVYTLWDFWSAQIQLAVQKVGVGFPASRQPPGE